MKSALANIGLNCERLIQHVGARQEAKKGGMSAHWSCVG